METGQNNPNYGKDEIHLPTFSGDRGGAGWVTRFIPDVEGLWQFQMTVDDGGDLWIDSTLIIDGLGWGTRQAAEATDSGGKYLYTNQEYNLRTSPKDCSRDTMSIVNKEIYRPIIVLKKL